MRSQNQGSLRSISCYVADANVSYSPVPNLFIQRSGTSYVAWITDPQCKAIVEVQCNAQAGSSLVSTPTSGSKSNGVTLGFYSSTTGVIQVSNFHITIVYRV